MWIEALVSSVKVAESGGKVFQLTKKGCESIRQLALGIVDDYHDRRIVRQREKLERDCITYGKHKPERVQGKHGDHCPTCGVYKAGSYEEEGIEQKQTGTIYWDWKEIHEYPTGIGSLQSQPYIEITRRRFVDPTTNETSSWMYSCNGLTDVTARAVAINLMTDEQKIHDVYWEVVGIVPAMFADL